MTEINNVDYIAVIADDTIDVGLSCHFQLVMLLLCVQTNPGVLSLEVMMAEHRELATQSFPSAMAVICGALHSHLS